MAEITKFSASEVAYHIKHDLREIPDGKDYGNESINRSLSGNNYSLLKGRCQTAEEANKYRKELEKEIHQYKRKNLVHAVEVVVQCPADCPPEQKDAFFNVTYEHICSTLPMGERCVFVAEVHVDERVKDHEGKIILDEYGNPLSKDHLHVMYVPAVPDTKHDGYQYKLCADQLTKRARLKEFHPALQKALDDAGIKATVYRKKEGDGKTIGLSVKQLKEITAKTGIKFEKSVTVDELAVILKTNHDLKVYDKALKERLREKEHEVSSLKTASSEKDHRIESLKNHVKDRDTEIENLRSEVKAKEATINQSKAADIESENTKSELQEQLRIKEAEKQRLIEKANNIISEKNHQIQTVTTENKDLQRQLDYLQKELEKSKERIYELEAKQHEKELEHKKLERDQTWGNNSGWGTTSSWGDNTKTYSEDKTW
ncbi:hypothetical protein SAMN02745229_03912 [Butyrivibrio fibrisolvens DSM 3071]|uniref:Plasmid recombination enzyme n=1 Tax=Butyrivibrio fibrisolvens DSM 3071 TaxID=1121131 RepID=A0A1M6FGX9_BUTFI|nr:plasmid recombination protein [Butyrivibrio fibrisolvens]SHI96994.1 hypothetical protein SAMN02745229_03912 [Butyrivibrio fibrisolvens DSM 3071]